MTQVCNINTPRAKSTENTVSEDNDIMRTLMECWQVEVELTQKMVGSLQRIFKSFQSMVCVEGPQPSLDNPRVLAYAPLLHIKLQRCIELFETYLTARGEVVPEELSELKKFMNILEVGGGL